VDKPGDLIQRTHEFALQALAFFRRLPKSAEAQVVGIQLYRAATAVESNYRAAKRGRSTAEFIAKLGVVVEEIDESVMWLEHLRDGKIAAEPTLLSEAEELRRIFGASLGTARRNAKARNMKRPRTSGDDH